MNLIDNSISNIVKNRTLLHVLYWILVFVFYCLYSLGHGQPLIVSFFLKLTVFPVQIIATYTFIYWQLPVLLKRQYGLFAFLFVLLTFPFYFLVHINYDLGIGRYLITWHEPHSLLTILSDLEFYLRYNVDIYLVVFVTATIKFIKEHLEARQEIEDLESEMTEVEYDILRSKLNPDFILKSLALIKTQSISVADQAPQTIAHLSNVLDDVLYQSQKEVRGLVDETERLKSFVELYEGSSNRISNISVETQFENPEAKIKTLVLNKLLNLLLDEIEESADKNQDVNVVVIGEHSKCILQVTITPIPSFNLSPNSIIEYMDIVYMNKYELRENNNEFSKDIQIIIEL